MRGVVGLNLQPIAIRRRKFQDHRFRLKREAQESPPGQAPVADARTAGLALQRQIERLDGWPGNLFDSLLRQQRVRASPAKAGTSNPPPQPCGMLSRYGCGLTAIHRDDRSPNLEGSYPCPYGPSTSRAGEGSSSVVRVVRTRFPAHIARQATTSAPDRSGIGHWRLLPDASMPGRQREWCGPTWPCIRCRLAPWDRWTCGNIGTEACRCFSILRVDTSRRALQQDIQPSTDRRQVI